MNFRCYTAKGFVIIYSVIDDNFDTYDLMPEDKLVIDFIKFRNLIEKCKTFDECQSIISLNDL